MARTASGEFATISGNQMGALLLDYVIKARRQLGTLPEGAYCVKSLVSTDMAYKIAKDNGIKLHDVLTGFKFIGEVIKNYEAQGKFGGFLLGFEESYGYLLGSYARDKDAVEGSMMILEMTAYYKKKGMTLSDALAELYKTYGLYGEKTIDIYMEGLDGIENRKKVMQKLRDNIPTSIGGVAVKSAGDYKSGLITELNGGKTTVTGQPSSDVLYYTLENEDKIIVRPSGTEPKIKIYLLAHSENKASLDEKVALYEKDARKMTEV
jgi:phosphoglucomutase